MGLYLLLLLLFFVVLLSLPSLASLLVLVVFRPVFASIHSLLVLVLVVEQSFLQPFSEFLLASFFLSQPSLLAFVCPSLLASFEETELQFLLPQKLPSQKKIKKKQEQTAATEQLQAKQTNK